MSLTPIIRVGNSTETSSVSRSIGRDLDLVVVAPDNVLAAFCTVWLDDVTRTAVFEPVGTHPNHQKRGLSKVMMAEGLRRAERPGADLAMGSLPMPYTNRWALRNSICWSRGLKSGNQFIVRRRTPPILEEFFINCSLIVCNQL